MEMDKYNSNRVSIDTSHVWSSRTIQFKKEKQQVLRLCIEEASWRQIIRKTTHTSHVFGLGSMTPLKTMPLLIANRR